VTGTVTGYSVSPTLPAGLSLNTSTGVISGTPSVTAASANYTVTASNSGGSTTGTVSVTVNPAGTTFTGLFGEGVNPTNVGSDGLTYLMKYALGGTNTNDRVAWPIVSRTATSLILTANVRTNDINLKIVGQSVTNLTGGWVNLSSNSNGVPSTNTNSSSVPAGCQRRDFIVDVGSNNRLFLKLKVSQ
jgi:hypothetical protein